MSNINILIQDEKKRFTLVIFDLSNLNIENKEKDLSKVYEDLIKIFSDTSLKHNALLDNFISSFVFVLFGIKDYENQELKATIFAKEINEKIRDFLKNYNSESGIKTIIVPCKIFSTYNKTNFYKIAGKRIEDFIQIFKEIDYFEIILSEEIYTEIKDLFLFEKIRESDFYKIIDRKKEFFSKTDHFIELKEELTRVNKILSEKIEKAIIIDGENFSGKSTLISQIVNSTKDFYCIRVNSSLPSYYLSIFKSIYNYLLNLIYSLNLKKDFRDSIKNIFRFFNNNEKNITSKYAIFDSFKNILKKILKFNKILIIIENCEYLDQGSIELIDFLIKSFRKNNLFFVLSKNKNFNINLNNKYLEYITLNKLNILPSLKEILQKIESLSTKEKEILNTIAVYGEEIDLYFLKRLLKDIDEDLLKLYKLNLLYETEGNNIYFTFRSIHNFIIQNIERKEETKIHHNIAKILQKYYSNSSYEKIAFHFERANDIKNAILYYFFAGIKYRDISNYQESIKMFDKAISLASTLNNDSIFYDKDLEVLTYNILKPFWSYKIKFRLSLSALYYFRLSITLPYENGYEELIEKLINNVVNDYSNFYIYILSQLEYFNYLLFNRFKLDLSLLSTNEDKVKEKKDELLLGIFYSYYMLILIAKNFSSEINKKNIIDKFFLARQIVVKSAKIDKETKRNFLSFWYDLYISYLKVENKNLSHILSKIKKGVKFCNSDFQKMSYFLKISSVLGPLNNTEYQQIYVKKALLYAKKSSSYLDIMHCYSTLGYLYLLKEKFTTSLTMNNKAKFFAFILEDKLELGMIYKNSGDLYVCLKDYKKAEIEYKNSIKYKEEIESTKIVVDFNNIIFPKSALCYVLIKNKKFDEAKSLLTKIESNMSRVFFGNEIPIFLNFLKQLFIIKDKYCEECIQKIKKCYFDIKNINPNAIQLFWIKQELQEYGVIV